MARVTVVAQGQAQLLDPFSTTLETRITQQLSAWYQVLSVRVERSYSFPSFYLDYRATIDADTKNLPADIPSVAEKVRLACTLATSFEPVVSVVSQGQPVPTLPHTTVDSALDLPGDALDIVHKLANGLGVTVETAKWLLVAIGIGGIALVYFVATKPGAAARIARG